MRRRRPQLTVSLFPFLSVLLCTLGSLILLLLVLDQKARQQRAEELRRQHEAARQEAERLETLAQRQLAELQDRAQQRVAAVRRRRDQLLEQQRALAGQQAAQEETRRRTEIELAALQQLLDSERRTSDRLGKELENVQAATAPLRRRKNAVENELNSLLDQVAALERTVEKLQLAAQQPRPVLYSLVPYRGRLGTGRRPIYVECVGQQVCFRPGGGSLFLTDLFEPGRLQGEIEERSRKHAASGDERPYVLLLIRPSGIPLYYSVLRALQDAAIDVGYEFIEEDWSLDFTEPKPEDGVAHASAVNGSPAPGGRGVPFGSASPLPAADPGGRGGGIGPAGAKGWSAARSGSTGPLLRAPLIVRAPPGTASRSPAGGDKSGVREPPACSETGLAGEKTKKDAAGRPPRSRLAGPTPVGGTAQREAPIVIECCADGVILHPEKTSFSGEELAAPRNQLLAAVRASVERRKRLPGLARPQIRFLIRPDGLRTYYRASALLEVLQLRSSAEMLRQDAGIEEASP